MLARMNNNFAKPLARKRAADRGGFDELGACPDNSENGSHAVFPFSPAVGSLAVQALFLHKRFNFGNPSCGPPEDGARLFVLPPHWVSDTHPQLSTPKSATHASPIWTEIGDFGMKRRIGTISLSVIPDDPRVRKQGDLLANAGWDVVAIGLPGHRSYLPAWRCVAVDGDLAIAADPNYRLRASALLMALEDAMNGQAAPRLAACLKVAKHCVLLTIKDPAASLWIARVAATRLCRSLSSLRVATGTVTPASTERLYWNLDTSFERLYSAARSERVDLWLANDWTSLPIVRKLAVEQGVPFAYDTHELAVDEYAERWSWRLLRRPMIDAIERAAMREAVFVSCVSEGIARRLMEFYGLLRPPLVICNTPSYQSIAFRPTGNQIRVLYHGLVSPGRGLEACIESVPLWRPEFALTIRGPANPEYLAHLTQLSREHGVADRVTFAQAVPLVDLVRHAAEHDVGLFALPGHSLQNIHVLPNKFFEYMMAGLALCVSDLPEMARILKRHSLGVLIEAVTPQAIAIAVNQMNAATIDTHKRNALASAREFNWENEGQLLLQACERAVMTADRARHVAGNEAIDSSAQLAD
jgi:glycosyltransferase involved in cell wall biosynthesis